MYITLDELALAASVNTEVADLTATLAGESNNFLSLSSYVEEDGYINLSKIASELVAKQPTKDFLAANHYDRMVNQYLGEGYKPLTLADIKVPEDFRLENYDSTSREIRDLLMETNNKHLELFTENPNIPNLGNSFAQLSENGDLILNEAAIAKRLEFLEFAKTITPEEITKNPAVVAIKVLYMFHESSKPLLSTRG
jgi:hypothetical protein